MKKNLLPLLLSASALLLATAAQADPVRINDADEGYSRLSRWEQHLDDRIADQMKDRSLNPARAWEIQKSLDSIEAHVLQSYYESSNGIDRDTFRSYSSQLRDIGNQLGDTDWEHSNGGDDWSDDHGGNEDDRGGYDSGGGYSGGPPPSYYQEGEYEQSCHEGNVAAGTIFGALAGGLIGGAASHGNAGAVVGGVIVGGALGNVLSQDIPCDDQRYAYDAYYQSLNGDLDRDYEWRHGDSYGSFRTTRAYDDNGRACREWHAVTWRDGQHFERDGSACRDDRGTWQTG